LLLELLLVADFPTDPLGEALLREVLCLFEGAVLTDRWDLLRSGDLLIVELLVTVLLGVWATDLLLTPCRGA
jgi:hypothetical protein